MAATMIKEQAIGAYSDYYLRLYFEETVNTTANTSTVTVSLYGYTERAESICSWNNSGGNSISVTIDGTTDTLSGQNVDTADWRASGGKLLHSYTKTIAHNTDGTKTIAVNGSLAYLGGGSSLVAGTYSTGSVSQALTTIARASTVGTISGTNINSTSGNVTINISKKNAAYYDRIVTTGAVSKTINIGQGTSGTIPWTNILDAMSSSASATLSITVRTYSDIGYTNLIGTNTGSANITISTSAIKPSVSWGAITANSGGLSGNLVAGKSTAKATWTVTNARGASVSSVRITGSNCTISSGASSTSASGTPVTATLPANSSANYSITLTATVTDSRGATATATTTAKTVYLYKNPSVTLRAYRTATNSSTTEDPAGGYVYVTYSASVGASVNGANSISSTTTSPSGVTSGSWRAVSASSTYTVSVTATDAAGGSTTARAQVSTALVPLSLYSNSAGTSVGVGIGGSAVAGKMTVNLPTDFNEAVNMSTPLSLGGGGTGANTAAGALDSIGGRFVFPELVINPNGGSKTITIGNTTAYKSLLILGTVGGTGGVIIGVTINNGSFTARNLMNNTAWSASGLVISVSGQTVTLTDNHTAGTRVTVYAG